MSERGARLLAERPDLPLSANLARVANGGRLALAQLFADAGQAAGAMPVELSAGATVIDLSNGALAPRCPLSVFDGLTGEPLGPLDALELSDRDAAEAERLLAELVDLGDEEERAEAREFATRWGEQVG